MQGMSLTACAILGLNLGNSILEYLKNFKYIRKTRKLEILLNHRITTGGKMFALHEVNWF